MRQILSKLKNNNQLRKIIRTNEWLKLPTYLLTHGDGKAVYQRYLFRRKAVLENLLEKQPAVRNLYIEGTNYCNADCVFCGYSQMQRPKSFMSMDLFKNVIDQYAALGGKAVGFTPIVGDPFIDKHLFERLDYVNQKEEIHTVGFYTNGIAFKKKFIDQIFDYPNINLTVSISFGGYNRETFHKMMGVDKFHIVQEHVLYLLDQLETKAHSKLKIKLDYRCPKAYLNEPYFKRIRECVDKGLVHSDTVEATFDTFGGYVSEERLDSVDLGLKVNYGIPKMGPCEILFTKPLVLADGRVNACAERDLEASLVIGDLNKQSLKEVFEGQDRMNLIQRFYDPKQIPPVCKACTVYDSIYNHKSRAHNQSLNWEASA